MVQGQHGASVVMSCPPLLAITDRPEHADAHWRIVRPFAHLRAHGITADLCWLADDEMPLIPVRGRVVVLQRVVVKGGTRERTQAWVQRLRDAGALAVVFEIDDDVIGPAYMQHIDDTGGLEMVGRARLEAERQGLEWALQASDGVTVTNEHLAGVVRQFTDRPVCVVPNAIDVAWFRERLARKGPFPYRLTIGWAGGRRPEADLEPMAVAWGRIARRYPDVRFVVAGWQPDCVYREIDDLDRIIRVPWAELDAYPRSMQVDIGCCAVADTPFARAKSPIKAWEYALAGAATVTTRALYGDELGLKATTADEWEDRLAILIEDHDFRRSSAGAASWMVEQIHGLTANLHRWADAYREIAAHVGVSV